jgi:hypothetical protein
VRLHGTAVAAVLAALAGTGAGTAAAEPARVRIDVALVDHKDGTRRVVSGTRIEGRPGTDFDLELKLDKFVLTGHFITDLVQQRALEVVARLASRRLYGRSQRDLPLWEEEAEERTLEVGFDEALVLWPFGRERNALSIEITAALTAPGPLVIQPFPLGRGGTLEVRARRVPHRFVCDAALVVAGRELARAEAECRMGRVVRLDLGASAQRRTVDVKVDGYDRDRPADTVTIQLDARAAGGGAAIAHAMGTARLGTPLQYPLEDPVGAELRLGVRLADGESAD